MATAGAHIGHFTQGLLAGQDTNTTWAEYRATIEHAIDNTPRTLQTTIGPSEIGNPCDRCLIHKLAGTPEIRTGAAWLPFVGTAVHEQLAGIFAGANATLPLLRYVVEGTVSVGEINGQDITGSADLLDLWTQEVTDWKICGANTLKKAKAAGPTKTYRYQGHLYGRGYQRRGIDVKRVRVAFLPRNSPTLRDSIIWTEPYDEQVALEALHRASAFAAGIATVGLETVLASAGPHIGEFSCARLPDSDSNQLPADPTRGHTTASLINA